MCVHCVCVLSQMYMYVRVLSGLSQLYNFMYVCICVFRHRQVRGAVAVPGNLRRGAHPLHHHLHLREATRHQDGAGGRQGGRGRSSVSSVSISNNGSFRKCLVRVIRVIICELSLHRYLLSRQEMSCELALLRVSG